MKRARKPAVEQQVADAADGLIAAWASITDLREMVFLRDGELIAARKFRWLPVLTAGVLGLWLGLAL